MIAVGKGGVVLIASSVPQRDRSAQLSNYPVDLLNSPPQMLEAHLRPADWQPARRGRFRANPQEDQPLRANRIGTPRNAFTELMTVKKPGMWFLLTAALIAIALGALHALEPGHGKTVVAAYLVGSRGTARHALMLAATVTASHTASVYVLGGLTLYASRWIIPERIYPWLGGVSGVIVAGLGVALFSKRLSGLICRDHLMTTIIHMTTSRSLHTMITITMNHEQHRTTIIIGDNDDPHFHPHRHDMFGRHIERRTPCQQRAACNDARAACARHNRRNSAMPRRAGGFAQRACRLIGPASDCF